MLRISVRIWTAKDILPSLFYGLLVSAFLALFPCLISGSLEIGSRFVGGTMLIRTHALVISVLGLATLNNEENLNGDRSHDA